jgi:hypothetical protein
MVAHPTARVPGPRPRASPTPLRHWVAIGGAEEGDLLLVDEARLPLQNDKLTELVRAHLLAAGVSRGERHKPGENRGQFRCHDLRSTFVAISLAKRQDRGPDRPGDQHHDQPLPKGSAV